MLLSGPAQMRGFVLQPTSLAVLSIDDDAMLQRPCNRAVETGENLKPR
jgi:hypothetical protein